MTAIATQAPTLSRQTIVMLLQQRLEDKIKKAQEKILELRGQLNDPSETDREAQQLHIASVGQDIESAEYNKRGLEAFVKLLGEEHPLSEVVSIGSILLLRDEGELCLWIIYDPLKLRQPEEHYVSINDLGVEGELGLSGDALALTSACPIGEALLGLKVEPGMEVKIEVGKHVNRFVIENVL